MMLTMSLPLLPPPPSSLLPPLNPSAGETFSTHHLSGPQILPHQHPPQHGRRTKPQLNARSSLAMLAADERTIAQRKMAIAMYGYSWLKPAGCAKTMLGRREEEIEREEVERQLREVELQDRMAMEAEAEEQERQAREAAEGEGPGTEGLAVGERDLDEDIPDADAGNGMVEEGEEADDVEADLDDEIPEADDDEDEDEEEEDDDDNSDNGDVEDLDADGVDGQWVYDSRREPDTDEDEGEGDVQMSRSHLAPFVPGTGPRRMGISGSEYDVDEREAEELANAMLDEEEMQGERDLDDEVPEAEEGEEETWEHTDSELEESEMDISILPAQGHGQGPGQMQGLGGNATVPDDRRRSSGQPWISDVEPTPGATRGAARAVRGSAARLTQVHTPGTVESISGLDLGSTMDRGLSTDERASARRNWLEAAGSSARRNLFGIGRPTAAERGGRGLSSTGSGLFTPSPAAPRTAGWETDAQAPLQQQRRRSGRLRGGVVGRRRAEEADGN